MKRRWRGWNAKSKRLQKAMLPELVWLLEHPPLYTAGTSAKDSDLILPALFPVHHTGRGGQYTYHGPGPAGGLCHA